MEVMPGLYRVALPLGGNPLGAVNAYLVKGDEGFLLIDCGWDTPEIRDTFTRTLADLGLDWSGLRTLLITHIHPDHYGLSGWIKQQAPAAEVLLHRAEQPYIGTRYDPDRMQEFLDEMAVWLSVNGVPAEAAPDLGRASLPVLERIRPAAPDRLLGGGECIRCGDWTFTVHWTPGHANGQICLHDAHHRLLIAADHVLPRITPSIVLHAQSTTNPLADYLESLRAIRALDAEVDVVVAGHGDPFTGLAERVDAIVAHHERRLDEMAAAVTPDGGSTAYEVAQAVRWRGGVGGWERLRPFDRRLAVMETLAHLELLYGRGHLGKRFAAGCIRYTRPAAA